MFFNRGTIHSRINSNQQSDNNDYIRWFQIWKWRWDGLVFRLHHDLPLRRFGHLRRRYRQISPRHCLHLLSTGISVQRNAQWNYSMLGRSWFEPRQRLPALFSRFTHQISLAKTIYFWFAKIFAFLEYVCSVDWGVRLFQRPKNSTSSNFDISCSMDW